MAGSRNNNTKQISSENAAGRAISAWRVSQGGMIAFSEESRSRILQSGLNQSEISTPKLFSSLFPPFFRYMAAAGLPLALLGLLLVASLPFGKVVDQLPSDEGHAVVSMISVTKEANHIVFKIANGGTSHYISKSSNADSFAPGTAVFVKNGSYRDEMLESGDLVFYRID